MDSLTESIAQADFALLTAVAALLDNEIIFLAVTFALVLVFERRKEKIAKIALAVALAVLLSTMVKNIVKEERPCVLLASKIACPDSYSFPSGHTILAFTVMLAFLNKPTFAIYLFYAAFIAFTRIYLGVHSLWDVAGSIAFAPFVYYTVDALWKKIGKIAGKGYAFRNRTGQ